jgi:hypothetical protein
MALYTLFLLACKVVGLQHVVRKLPESAHFNGKKIALTGQVRAMETAVIV